MDTELLSALLKVVQHKDAATAAHTWRVALYSLALAEAAGEDRELQPRLMRAAVLHDIGKIDIPRHIVAKPGRLSKEEYELVKAHTWLGYERLVRMGERDPIVLDTVRSHHERLDGSGYPDGLSGEEIPIVARRFAVIDSFDAMTSLRPYRAFVGTAAAERAIEELERHVGTRYCPHAVALFKQLFESGDLDWIIHHLNDEESLIELPPTPDQATIDEARRRIDHSHDDLVGPPEIRVDRIRDVPETEREER